MIDDRDAEIARLTARVDELRAANNVEVERRRHAEAKAGEYLKAAAEAGTALMRANVALALAREWGVAAASWHHLVARTVADWIDTPAPRGPIPWPDSSFFAKWAAGRGYSNVNGSVGFRAMTDLVLEAPAAADESAG